MILSGPIGARRRALPIVPIGCALSLSLWLSSAALAAPPVGGRVGHWDLGDLGARSPLRLEPTRRTATVRFRLRAGARQGEPLWYLIRLQATVRFARGVAGRFLLNADVNDTTAAQIPIVARRRSLRLEELGLVAGRRTRTVPGREANVDFRNYIQITGIRGGSNVLGFTLEPLGVRGLSRAHAFDVAVRGRTGIEATRVLPDELLLGAEPAAVTAPAGQSTSVGYLLRRRGGRADDPVEVRFAAGGLDLRGSDVQRFPRVGTGIRGAFSVVGVEPGTYMTMLSVPDRFNAPSTPVTVTIVGPTPSSTDGASRSAGRIAAAGLLVVAGVALLLRGRHTSSRSPEESAASPVRDGRRRQLGPAGIDRPGPGSAAAGDDDAQP